MLEILIWRLGFFAFSLVLASALGAAEDHLARSACNIWQDTPCSDPTWSMKRDLYLKFENKIFFHRFCPWIIFPEFTLVYIGLKRIAELALNRYIEHKHLEIQRKELLGKSD